MVPKVLACVVALLFSLAVTVHALGSSCTAPLGPGTAGPNDPFWMENIKHQGTAAFNPNPSGYQVFRNVKVCGHIVVLPDLVPDQPIRTLAQGVMVLQTIRQQSSRW
jgi:hypothetical protein